MGHEALPEDQEGWEWYGRPPEGLQSPTGGPGVVGRPSQRAGNAREAILEGREWLEVLPEGRVWLEGPPKGPEMVHRTT